MTDGKRSWLHTAARIFAVSPLIAGALVAVDVWLQSDVVARRAPTNGVLWSEEIAWGPLPTPDAARPALRHDLPSGYVVYETLGNITVRESGTQNRRPTLFLELVDVSGRARLSALRSAFFGPLGLDLDGMLEQTLSNEDEPRSLVEASESSGTVRIVLQGGAAYAANSLIIAINVGPDVDTP